MEIKNALKPSHEQMENFNSGDLDTPIFMVTLLKFSICSWLGFKAFLISIFIPYFCYY